MALPKALVASLFLAMLVLHHVDAHPAALDHHLMLGNGRALLQAPTLNCDAACGVRCSKAWKRKMCLKLCGICCSQCHCVPPGTSAEARSVCPCYANKRTPKGQLKCP